MTCSLHSGRRSAFRFCGFCPRKKKHEFTVNFKGTAHATPHVTKADMNRATAPQAPYFSMSPSLNFRILVMTSSIASSGGRKVVLRAESRVSEKWERCDASNVAPDVLGTRLLTESAARNNTNSGCFEKLESVPASLLPREARPSVPDSSGRLGFGYYCGFGV